MTNTICSWWKLGSDCRVGTSVVSFILADIVFEMFFSEKVGKIIIKADFLDQTDNIVSSSIKDLLITKTAISGFDQITKTIMFS